MNESFFKLLFMQAVESALSQSVPENAEDNAPDQELAFYRIERIGFQVGQRLIDRLTLGHRLFADQLDVFKYICKEYWHALFRKQIDNLKTNHKVRAGGGEGAVAEECRGCMCCWTMTFPGLRSLRPTFPCQTRPRWQSW